MQNVLVAAAARLVKLNFILLCVFFSACSSTKTQRVTPEGSPQLEFISRQQQAYEEIIQQPTDFVISYAEDQLAWARAIDFLKTRTKNLKIVEKSALWELKASNQNYIYSVVKKVSKEGLKYSISVNTGLDTNRPLAELNAKSLAMFIKEARLDSSFVSD